MDELQHLVDNIDIAHPNIYISSCRYKCPIYHMNYLPYHIDMLITRIMHKLSSLDYLPSNIYSVRYFASGAQPLYNLPPLITYIILLCRDKEHNYKSQLVRHYLEYIGDGVQLDFCDIVNNSTICSMWSYCKQNAFAFVLV
jgi:hypothetical protein